VKINACVCSFVVMSWLMSRGGGGGSGKGGEVAHLTTKRLRWKMGCSLQVEVESVFV